MRRHSGPSASRLARRPAGPVAYASWTPANLAPGKAKFWSGRTIASVASATNGTGALTGADDTNKVAWLADLSPSGKPLIQATSGSRPVVRASALGRGIAVHGDGAAAVLEAATTLAGVRHCWAAITFRGDNAVRILGDEPANFVAQYQSYVGCDAIANPSAAALVGNVGTNDLLKTGHIAGTYYRNGSAASDVGRQRLRQVARFTRTADMDTGRIRLLSYEGDQLWAQGCVHEVFLGSSALDATDIANLDTYFSWHLAAPVVACSVDSLTVGKNLAQNLAWPHLLWRDRWGGCVSVPNLGIAGQTITSAISGDPAKLAACKGTGKNVLVLLAGANDVLNGETAAGIWAELQTYITAATAAGWQVVVCSVPSGSGYSGPQQTVLSTLRGLISGGYVAAGAAAYVDLFGLTLTLQGDGIHFTSGDCTTVANAIGPAVDTLL